MPAPPKFNAGSISVMAIVTHNDTDEMIRAIRGTLDPASLSLFLRMEMLPHLRRRATERFASEGDAASGKWAPLHDSTNAIREALGYPAEHPINRRTGALERWITRGQPTQSMDPEGATLIWPGDTPGGSMGAKVRTAQQGRPNARDKSPATVPRPVIAVNQSDMSFMMTAWSIFFASEFLKRKGSGGVGGGMS